ncbi:acyl-CoA thioesterase [Sporomusa aerivorans]|uniref:acyl-CoA thioesterase n=1 Tax=Sporomusa aerivorans TaxID=204936 RepID=UPI00352A7E7E
MKSKSVEDSKVSMSVVMMPQHANPAGNVHGGEIMKIMDNTAGVVARRHARTNIVTARVDEMEFHQPIRVGDVVTCYGELTFAGKSSMEVSVTVTVEDLSKEEPALTALTAFFTLVSLDADGHPQAVPALAAKSEAERCAFAEGYRRYLAYKLQRKNTN